MNKKNLLFIFSLFPFFVLLILPLQHGGLFAGETPENEDKNLEIFKSPYPNSRRPFIRNYHPMEYKGQNQMYEIVQDKRGVMYFGNNVYGVIEYDGINWTYIPLANNNTAYSLSLGKDGRVYVGGFDEIGYIEVEGEVSKYKSLMAFLPENIKQLGVVSSVRATDKGVYFKAGGSILRWFEGAFTVMESISSAKFGDLFLVRGKVFTMDSEGTVYKVDGGAMETIYNEDPDAFEGDIFKTGNPEKPPTHFILPYGKDEILLSSWNFGLIIIGDGVPRPLENEAQNMGLLGRNYSLGSTVLPNGEYALSTTDGIFIIGSNGEFRAWLSQGNGLINNHVRSIFADNQNFLWAGTSYGFSQILYPSPFSLLNESSGIRGQIRMSAGLGDALYVMTSKGAYRGFLSSFHSIGIQFKKIPVITGETGYIKNYGDSVLIANINGFYQISEGGQSVEENPANPMEIISTHSDYTVRALKHLKRVDCRFIKVSEKYPGIVYVGTPLKGIYVLREKNDVWEQIANIEMEDQIFFGDEDSDGVLWVSGVATGGYSLDFSGGDFSKPEIKNYYTNEGFPEGWYVPSTVGGELYMYSDEAFLRFDKTTKKFVPEHAFFRDMANTGFIQEAPDGNVWITKGRPRKLKQASRGEEGNFKIKESPFQRFDNFQVRNFGFDRNGVAWFGAGKSLLSYDPRIEFDYRKPYGTLIRKVKVNEKPILGEGSSSAWAKKGSIPAIRKRGKKIELPYDRNNIRFDFAGLYIDTEFANAYQVWMEGLDKHWSTWSKAGFKEYNSLPPANYTFHVRTKNLYGTVGKEAVFHFMIHRPWWESHWFYASEIGLFFLLLLASIFLNRSGEPTRFSRTVQLVTIVIVFEFIMMIVEPMGEAFAGGIPLIQLVLNVMMAMVFEPAQALLKKIGMKKRIDRVLRISYEKNGQWSGGATIIRSLENMENMDRWVKNFRKEFEEIGTNYMRYLENDWVLRGNEKADLAAKLEFFLGGVLLFRRFVTKGQPKKFSAMENQDNITYKIKIFPGYWEGEGVILKKHQFQLADFVDWYQHTLEKIDNMFAEYAKAMEDNVLSDEERKAMINLIEKIIRRVLIVGKALVLPEVSSN